MRPVLPVPDPLVQLTAFFRPEVRHIARHIVTKDAFGGWKDPVGLLDIDDEARALAQKIIAGKGIPAAYPEDALHIAVAAVNGIEVVITWNFAHLSNPFTRKIVRQIVESEKYACPEMCSPEELLEVDK